MQPISRSRSGSEVTIDDVAAEAGVSIRTVSRVLNNSTNVNSETRARVEEAVAKLKFRPSLRARGLATGRSYLVGLLHHEANALILGEVLRGAVAEAARHGYEVIVHPTPPNSDDAIGDTVDFVQRSRVDGMIVMAPISGLAGLPQALSEAGVLAFALSAVPLEGFAETIVYNEREGAALAARHLIELGHRRIGMVSGPNLISAYERRNGFIDALHEAGIEIVADIRGDYSFASGVSGGAQLLDIEPPITAIFGASDTVAAGVLKAASDRGVSVPQTLSVVGFDCSMLAPMLTPSLTAVHRPMRDVAEVATERLIRRIEGTAPSSRIPEAIRLQINESTSHAPAIFPELAN